MIRFLTDTLQLPPKNLIGKKLTKAFFYRNFELTTAETKLLENPDTIMQMDWLASINHQNANIPAFSAEDIVIEEIVVLAVLTGATDLDKTGRKIAELIQKYIPYHILLLTYNKTHFLLNTCDKRINQNDTAKRIVETHYSTDCISRSEPAEKHSAFLKSLAFAGLDKQNLRTLYDSYTNRIVALQAAELTGGFEIRNRERSKQDVQNLEQIALLESEIETLTNKAKKESQLSILITLNTEMQNKKQAIEQLKKIITASG